MHNSAPKGNGTRLACQRKPNTGRLLVQTSKSSLAALTLGAIGVVYGDIGTSVLYVDEGGVQFGHVPFTADNIYGILSIFFWTLTVIVSIKYVLLVLRADNHGEGGLIAMLALASTSVRDKPELRRLLLVVGIFGTCLFYGDGVITPAISVLSAIEGLGVVSPQLEHYVIPLTLAVLFCLFAVQKRGTGGIGRFFGPITLVWFAAIALLGIAHILTHPEVLKALSPRCAAAVHAAPPGDHLHHPGRRGAVRHGGRGAVCRPGALRQEAHPGARYSLVIPSLPLNYFGQGALLLANPEAVQNPFYLLAPEAVGDAPAGPARDDGHGDRLAGRHLLAPSR